MKKVSYGNYETRKQPTRGGVVIESVIRISFGLQLQLQMIYVDFFFAPFGAQNDVRRRRSKWAQIQILRAV